MSNLKLSDLPVLQVLPTATPPATPPAPEDLKYDIYYATVNPDGTPQPPMQVNLCGFSFFGEIAGLPGSATEGIVLLSDSEITDPAHPPMVLTGGLYKMTFDYYLDQLQASKINYSRLFLFPLYDAPFIPFARSQARTDPPQGKYDLTTVSNTFLDRLEQFISKARSRGIIIGISFFSHQMLEAPPRDKSYPWSISPFNYKNNTSAVYQQGKLVDAGFINAPEGALIKFFEISPVADNAAYDQTWSHEQKLFWVQRNLVQKIVLRTRPYWNVIYELFNEPIIPATLPPREKQRLRLLLLNWFDYMAGWVNASLLVNNRRTRLVSLVAGDDLLGDLLSRLAPQESTRLVDIFSFHGFWGGDPGKSMLCNYAHSADRTAILNGINNTIKNFPSSPLALIFDSDALYWAQKNPSVYLELLLNKDASFNYRWPFSLLDEVKNPDDVCDKVAGPKVGLAQRLSLINKGAQAAQQGHTITVFPRPPAGTPTDLTVTVEIDLMSGQPLLHLSFNSAGGDQEGYAALFGQTPDTLGQGTDVFPPVKYFPKAAAPRQDLRMSFTLPSGNLNAYVAVAARNGVVTGDFSETRQVVLPATPTGTPTGLVAIVEFVNKQSQVRLTFNRADGPHDGYVAFFGPADSSLGTGTDIFPGTKYFAKTDDALQQCTLTFNPTSLSTGVYIAVAARNGPFVGQRSNVVHLSGYDARIDLSNTSLHVGANATVPKRQDFRETATMSNHVAFKNTGLNKWEWQTDYAVPGSLNSTQTLGVYMPVRDMTSGLALIFIAMRPENRPGNSSAPVLPGQTAIINLNIMQLTSKFETFADLDIPLLLPYSRKPLRFHLGMGTIRTIQGGFAYGHFGEEYDNLPDSAKTPVQVSVDEPERQAFKPPAQSTKLGPNGFVFNLTSGHDASQYLASVTASTPSPNTIIRPRILLQNTASTLAPPSRLLRVSLEGSAGPVDINVCAVKLQPIDLYYAGPHRDPKSGLYDVPGGGKTASGTLDRFEDLYTDTAAYSDTPINPVETITWEVRPGWSPTQTKQLVITNNATVSSAKVATFTVEVWENLTTLEDQQRQKQGELTFDLAAPGTAYVVLDDTAAAHRYYLATLHADKLALISYEIVLRAEADGIFKRCLEVRASNFAPPLKVTYKTLDVHVIP
jgi:hypothetical protein